MRTYLLILFLMTSLISMTGCHFNKEIDTDILIKDYEEHYFKEIKPLYIGENGTDKFLLFEAKDGLRFEYFDDIKTVRKYSPIVNGGGNVELEPLDAISWGMNNDPLNHLCVFYGVVKDEGTQSIVVHQNTQSKEATIVTGTDSSRLWYIFFEEYMVVGKGEKDVLEIRCYDSDNDVTYRSGYNYEVSKGINFNFSLQFSVGGNDVISSFDDSFKSNTVEGYKTIKLVHVQGNDK